MVSMRVGCWAAPMVCLKVDKRVQKKVERMVVLLAEHLAVT